MSGSRLSVAVLADVGGELFHVGDEAMLDANLERLRRYEADCEVRLIGRLAADDAEARSALALAARRFAGASDEAVPEALARGLDGVDALFVSGGGNLSSAWPDLLWQRIQLMRAARQRGAAVVLGGQTIGPSLGVAERHALATVLASVQHLGVRERPSAALAAGMGVPADSLCRQPDDAFLLGGLAPAAPNGADDPFLAITIDPGFASLASAWPESLGSQIAEIAASSGLRVVMIPHVGTLGGVQDGDGVACAVLRDRLVAEGVEAMLLPVMSARETVWYTQRAAAVISSRYHPLVFATAGAVPSLGVACDAYTRVKIAGALGQVGMERWCLSAENAGAGGLARAFGCLWSERDLVREAMREARADVEAREERRWEIVMSRLGRGRLGERRPLVPVGARSNEPRLSEEQWACYARDGFLDLGRILDDGPLEALRRRADDLATGLVENPSVLVQADTGGDYEQLPEAGPQSVRAGLLYRKVQGLETDEMFASLVVHPLFLEICDHEYGPHVPISIFRAMIMNKPAGQGTDLPWHQDGGDVWALDRDPLVTVWVALDPATRASGCMEVIPGSHRLGLLSAHGSTLSRRNAARYAPAARARPLEVEVGHGVLVHNWLIHRSGVNSSSLPRRAFTACFMDARTRSTLTGDHFPVVAGMLPIEPHPFIRQLRHDGEAARASFAEAERYALSLRDEVERLHAARDEAERYAKSLEAERERLAARSPAGPPRALRSLWSVWSKGMRS